MSTKQRTAIVTGGSTGIGRATCLYLAKRGYNICFTYNKSINSASSLLEELNTFGVAAEQFQIDFEYSAHIRELFEFVDSTFENLDALINNAALMLPQTNILSATPERTNRMMQVNFTAPMICCREAIRRMSTTHQGQGGSIVNVSSIAARTGSPNEYLDYAASKGALDTLTKGLSLEVAKQNIRVNAVRPGFINTKMHADGGEPDRIERLVPNIPMGRGGTAEEVANAIGWLLSDKASYVTGSFIDIGGGK